MCNFRTNKFSGNSLPFILILCISIIVFIGRLIWMQYSGLPLNSDEAQYWVWSNYPDFSYYSKPPMVAYMNYISTLIVGQGSALTVRINSALIGLIIPLLTYWLTFEIFENRRVAFWSSLSVFILPHYNYISTFFTTDAPLSLFWLLTMIFSWRAVRDNKIGDWILGGLFLGLGNLSKYTMIMWVPIFMLFIWVYRRETFKDSNFYIAAVVAAVVTLPLLLWNIGNDFVSVKHLFGIVGGYKAESSHIISPASLLAFIAGQLVAVIPLIIPLLFRGGKSLKKLAVSGDEGESKVFYVAVPFIIILLLFTALSPFKSEVNWTFFAFSSLPIVIGYSVVNFPAKRGGLSGIGWFAAAAIMNISIMIMITNPTIFDRIGLSRVYTAKIDPLHRLSGWDKLGERVSKYYNPQDSLFVLTDSYHMASELWFYMEEHPNVFCLNRGRRMNQFDLWPGVDKVSNMGYDSIFVSKSPPDGDILEGFQKAELLDTFVNIYRGREFNSPVYIYRLSKFSSIKHKSFGTY